MRLARSHALTVIGGYYCFHARFGAGPVLNPVPVSAERRRALAHRSPLEPVPAFRRARLRQKVPTQAPRAIPDHRWDELVTELDCDRDRALLEFYVSSGARASELLGIGVDTDVTQVRRGWHISERSGEARGGEGELTRRDHPDSSAATPVPTMNSYLYCIAGSRPSPSGAATDVRWFKGLHGAAYIATLNYVKYAHDPGVLGLFLVLGVERFGALNSG
jgi:hypothetical protein